MEKKAFYGLDVMKFISAFLVICVHTGPFLDMNTDVNFVVVQIISRIAVPFFFVASGFLFFEKIKCIQYWHQKEKDHHLQRYILRILKIYCIWTIVYLPFTYILLRDQNGIPMISVLRYVRDFFLNGSYYHLWFLPALIVSVPLVYVCISKWGITITLMIGCILYGMGMGINVYPQVVARIPGMDRVLSMYTLLFSTARNGLFFGTIYVAMGALFAYRSFSLTRKQVLVGLIISTMLYVAECFFLREQGFMNAVTSMYSMLLPWLFFFFLFLIRINWKKRPMFKMMRAVSVLIYVSHIMISLSIYWIFPTIHSLPAYILTAICSFVFSMIIYKASQTIRLLKHVYE